MATGPTWQSSPTGGQLADSGTSVTGSVNADVTDSFLTESDFDTKIGALTETAPATDTASSGVNGRLQRIAQRLTSIIALLPTSLGVNSGLKVDGVSEPVYTAPVSGELAGATSATQMPSVACRMVKFKAQYDNAGRVYIGVSGVTKADGTTDTTTGLQLTAGEETGWIPIDNLNRMYRICDNTGDDLTYLALA